MPSIAECFLRLRVDESQVKSDVERGLDRVDTGTSGSRAGKSFGAAAGAEGSKGISDALKTADWVTPGKDGGRRTGTGFVSSFLSSFRGMAPSLSKTFATVGEEGSTALSGAFKGGLMSPAGIGAAVTVGLAVAPGLFAAAGAAGAVALGAAFAIKGSPVLQAEGKKLISDLSATMTSASSVLVQPISQAFGFLEGQLPVIRGLFATTFSDVAPLVQPMAKMLTDLVEKTMPGFNALMRAAQGPLSAFFNTAGQIVGTGLGNFFRSLGPGVAPSLSIITDLMRILSGLLPAIGGVTSALATGLAPAFRLAAETGQAIYNGVHDVVVAFNYAKANIPGFAASIDKVTKSQDDATGSGSRFNEMLRRTTQSTAQTIPVIGPMIGVFASLAHQHNNAAAGAQKQATYQVVLGQRYSAFINVGRAASNVLAAMVGTIDRDVDATQQAAQSWQKYIDVITGSFGSMKTLRDDLSGVTRDMRGVKGSFDGSSNAALTYRADLSQAITDAGAFIVKLRQQASAAGNTKAAQAALSEGIKGTIGQLIPAASRSSVMRDALVAMARQNGFTGSSFRDLTKWVGGTTNATKHQTDASNTLSRAAANATSNQKIFQTALQGTINHLGLSKQQADNLTSSINKIPASKRIAILEQIKGTGNITVLASDASAKLTFGTPGRGGHAPGTGYAVGGFVTGPGGPRSDSIPIWASNGEFVMQADAVRKYGLGLMHALNAQRLAAGGLVNNTQTGAGVAAGNLSLIADTVKFTEPAIRWATSEALTQVVNEIKQQLASVFGANVPNVGSGVARWAGIVDRALSMLHLPWILARNVLVQMQSESGGNPNAINLWDSNARAGDPSRGLMQVIGSTFRAYHVAGTSWNIYDPLANVAAAINYGEHVYGPTLQRGGRGIGSGRGYASGGMVREPVFGVGASGQRYTFGEAGSELVSGQADIQTVVAELRALRAEMHAELPARTAAGVAKAINGRRGMEAQNARLGSR